MAYRHRLFPVSSRAAVAALACLALAGCASLRAPWRADSAASVTSPAAARSLDRGEAVASAPRVIDADVARREVRRPKVAASNAEIGAWFGVLGSEDFGSRAAYGVRAVYHLSSQYFVQADLAQSTLGRASIESTLPGQSLPGLDAERRVRYYSLSYGWNFLPGEVFLGPDRSLNSALYLIGGVGAVDPGEKRRFALNFGAGFRILPTERLSVHFDVQDRVYYSDLLGPDKLTHNVEARIGVAAYF